MALTKCEECGGQLSDRAEQCPHCGAPLRKRTRRLVAMLIGVGVALFAGLMSLMSSREGAGADSAAPPMIIGGVIVGVAALMGIVVLIRSTRR